MTDDARSRGPGPGAATDADRWFHAVVDHVDDAVSVHGADGRVRLANPAFRRLVGLAADGDPAGISATSVVHPDDVAAVQRTFASWLAHGGDGRPVEYRLRTADGSWREVVSVAGPGSVEPRSGDLVVTTRHLGRRSGAEGDGRSFHDLHDPLTGLPNRSLFLDRLGQALARAERAGSSVAVVVADLDRFAMINESLGHGAGDEVVVATARLLEAATDPGDTLARLNGDEFVLCVEDVGAHGAVAAAQRLQRVLAAPFGLAKAQIHVTASVGVAVGGVDVEPERLLRDAEAALHRAKQRGPGGFAVFDEAMLRQSLRRLQLEADLRRAVEGDELRVHFQPEVDLRTGQVVGVEALVRWDHPELGLVHPHDFIPLAEETGVILPLGRTVLAEACRHAARWHDVAPERPFMVSVNLSARQLADRSLVDTVRQAVASNRIQPATLCLEITESVLMDEAESSVRTLRALKALGVRLAVDDFGTGYSSLSYLKRFPVDFLKIDRSFVDGLGRDLEDTAIVSAVVTLAHSLGLEVVAEGVETVQQLQELRRLGASHAQGFHWSEPVPAEEVERLLTGEVRPPDGEWGPEPGSASDALLVALNAAAHADGARAQSFDEAVRALTHELRTPLAIIIGFAETLAQLDDDDERMRARAVGAIGRAAAGMRALIDSLVAVGALDAGDLRLDLRPAELGELVTGVVDDLATTALAGRRIEVEIDAEAPVLVDPVRVGQILTNLLTNAAKFSPPDEPITVRLARLDSDVEVHVVDRGPGIPPDRVADVFRKFSRLDRTKAGTGLGLYLARGMARAHGGELSCRRVEGGGSDFVLTLALHTDTADGADFADDGGGEPARR